MERSQWCGAAGMLTSGLLLAVFAGPAPAQAVPVAADGTDDSLIMVLDSSGSMAGEDGSGRTRMASAKKAVNTVVDALPDGYPTGLRVYGASRTHGCDDTQLVEPVQPLDRAAMKKAVAGVRPKGDTPIGLSLHKAAADLPEDGRRTILLVSDGEANCGTPPPCEAAQHLAAGTGDGTGLRIDTIGFQVRGKARKELECIAGAGHGHYYDAPDAESLARQLERASQLSADAYRFKGEQTEGGSSEKGAPGLQPGQYLDTIGPGEIRWYAATLDGGSAADLAVTAVPQAGVKAAYGDGIELKLVSTGGYTFICDTAYAHFGQDEGAMALTSAVSRIPSSGGDSICDRAGRYLLSVHRTSDEASDPGRWPVELRYGTEAPLKSGTTPAPAETGYGDTPASLTGAPKDIEGGTGFNDARAVTKGVWRDKLLPAQTRYYKVHVGWGQQLRYTAEFANEPVLDDTSASSYVATAAYGPGRRPIGGGPDDRDDRSYHGKPLSVGLDTVPVTWTNRWVTGGAAPAVRSAGDYYIAVSLGPEAAQFAKNAAVGVVLRVNVTGRELAGPRYKAPALAEDDDKGTARAAGPADGGDNRQSSGGGFMTEMIVVGVGGAVALAAVAGVALARRTRRGGT